MSEVLSGLVQQTFQQALQNQSVQQQTQTTQTKGSFESYLQKGQDSQSSDKTKTSGVQLDAKLEQMQNELAQKIKSNKAEQLEVNKIPNELLDTKNRLGLMREAMSELGSSATTGGFEGRLINMETSYKEIEALMTSDKNLSPGELLALQARLYQVSQHIEVMSKVVDQMAGGIKTVLNTNL